MRRGIWMSLKSAAKSVISLKKIGMKNTGKEILISYKSSIKGKKYIDIKDKAIISDYVSITVEGDNAEFLLKENSSLNKGTTVYVKDSKLSLGKNSFINEYGSVYALANVTIGDNVMIGPKCNIIAANHNYSDIEKTMIEQGHTAKGITIEDNVWLGANVTILDDVTIGTGSIIAAGAVVSKDVLPNCIYGGVPAKLIKKRV